jgi:abortive infection bacteriophage resistance protein
MGASIPAKPLLTHAHSGGSSLVQRCSLPYTKLALTFEQQADLLLSRGLLADRDELLSRLRSVSYYRLSGYWYPFRLEDDSFIEGTTLAAIWSRYTFDRRFRLLVMDAVERVEVCIRTEIVYRLAHLQGAFGYLERANLPNMPGEKYDEFVRQVIDDYGRSHEQFIKHFAATYGADHLCPPYWMITELMTFGTLLTLFKGSPREVKKHIAARFGVADVVLESWLGALNVVRNICAHHGRLWNRELGYKPLIPKRDDRWHDPVEIPDDRSFGILTILKYLLDDIAPQSGWVGRLEALHAEYPTIPQHHMGYPDNWHECPIWK